MANGQSKANVEVRPLASTDSIADLTALLHRAYADLAARGMRFLATHQDEATTARRVAEGECLVAADAAGVVIGTVVLRDAARTAGTPWYDRPDVASFGQFGVEPAWQGRGVGSRLLDVVEQRAREKGVAELALDTAETAADLIAYYARRGYRFIEHARWSEVNYRSVILSKSLVSLGPTTPHPPRNCDSVDIGTDTCPKLASSIVNV